MTRPEPQPGHHPGQQHAGHQDVRDAVPDVPGTSRDVPEALEDVPDVLEQLDGPAWRAQLRADVDLLTAAAAALRHAATQGAYQGRREPDRAYAIASVLDLAGLRWRDQDPALRTRLRAYSRLLLDTDPHQPGHQAVAQQPDPGPAARPDLDT